MSMSLYGAEALGMRSDKRRVNAFEKCGGSVTNG